ncbi:hypothetical protein CCL08_01655 [Pseudomonas congelans]|uniref:hypothetical protein n=2 Tax=Pseudomonas TaxID=286 RepID=UPI000BB94588|nr:hypothetical protein [Pseudomonas congelans]PBQ22003.1 hypothetical protein CCL08_01655 [Pseudomonas congelans]
MDISENEFRDFLFEKHSHDISSIIKGRREPVAWLSDSFPPMHILLQQRAEKKINEALDNLEDLILVGKELRLTRASDSTTRIDLVGNSESSGLTIIELKKSKQTERQAFSELLAYSNHFCTIFPGLKENSVTSVLVAPMETRTIRDAYAQELVSNNKCILSLIPEHDNSTAELVVYYPDASYYKWFENNLLDDRSIITVALAFSELKGWIDLETDQNGMPEHSARALNVITSEISKTLEASGFHSMCYSTQPWGEIAMGLELPYPNVIYVAAINPFSSFRTSVSDDQIYGASEEGRIAEVQAVYNQLENDKEFWIDTIEANFHNRLIRTVRSEFEKLLKNKENTKVRYEISLPDWYGLKTSMIDSVAVNHADLYLSGLLREIHSEYMEYAYHPDVEHALYYADDIPKYFYRSLRKFLPIWEIMSGLGVGNCEEDQ